MSKKTVLRLTQDILEDLKGDAVNSISDTEESEIVAGHLKKTYENIINATNWPHTRRATAIVPRSDSDKPTHCDVSDTLKELVEVKYNKIKLGETRKVYKTIEWLDVDQFLAKINSRDNDSATVDVITDDSGIELLISTNKAPDYYTSIDDYAIIFDSYDSEVDSSLQQSKFQAYGYMTLPFLLEDSHIPDLPADAFSLLLEKATARCQLKMREFQDLSSEREARKQGAWQTRKNWTVGGGIRYPNYGIKR